jgi:hypothetical protein
MGLSQTKKTFEKKEKGCTFQTPYISQSEYHSISVRDSLTSSKSTSRNSVIFQDLLSVSSLDEVTRLLGQPEDIDRNVFPDGKRFIATLHYEGMMLKYVQRKEGRVRLNTMEIRSPRWAISVGGTILRSGMSVEQLSPQVRASIDGDTFLEEKSVDGVGTIRVASPEKPSEKGQQTTTDRAQLTIHVNRETGTVKVVRFHRIV